MLGQSSLGKVTNSLLGEFKVKKANLPLQDVHIVRLAAAPIQKAVRL